MSKLIPRKILIKWLAADAKESIIKMLENPLVLEEFSKHIQNSKKIL